MGSRAARPCILPPRMEPVEEAPGMSSECEECKTKRLEDTITVQVDCTQKQRCAGRGAWGAGQGAQAPPLFLVVCCSSPPAAESTPAATRSHSECIVPSSSNDGGSLAPQPGVAGLGDKEEQERGLRIRQF